MKLILHFDVNKTIMMADPVNKKAPDYVFQCSLAENPKYSHVWKEGQAPTPYYDYLNQKFPNDKDARKKALEGFVEHCKEMKHPHFEEIRDRYESAHKACTEHPLKLTPAFYNLLSWLHRMPFEFKILIRTFGIDLPEVEEELKKETKLALSPQTKFENGVYKQNTTEVSFSLRELPVVYAIWMLRDSLELVQDHFDYWETNQKKSSHGKQFPLKHKDAEEVSIFFDDNIEKGDGPKNIIAPFDVTTGKYLDVAEVLATGEAYIVDPLEVVEDPDYFIKKIRNTADLALERSLQEVRNSMIPQFRGSFQNRASEEEANVKKPHTLGM